MTTEQTQSVAASPFLQLLDPAVRADPYPTYRWILSECPVSEGPFGSVVLARYADCAAVIRDARVSNNERHSATFQGPSAPSQIRNQGLLTSFEQRSFLFLDPPDHTRLRRLVSKAFTPRVVEGLRPTVQRWVDELVDRVADQGRIELIDDLAYPLPVRVICKLLGVPPEDHETFRGWSRHLARNLDPPIAIPPDERQRMRSVAEELTAYLDEIIARRRKQPGDDLLSALIAAEEQGDQLTATEINATCRLLLLAGHETTVNLIANGMLALLRHPDQLERLRADPSLATTAVEEVLRYDPPVQFMGRITIAALEVGEARIGRGQHVMLLLPAAQRDPARFADPDRFDIGRADNHHLAFGGGIHFCLGAPLARLEGQIALSTLAQRLVDPQLETERLQYKDHIVLRGLEALPITFTGIRPVESRTH